MLRLRTRAKLLIVLGACVAFVATAAPGQAATTCTYLSPCLPLNSGFWSVMPTGDTAIFWGTGAWVLDAENRSSDSSSTAVTGEGPGIGVYGLTRSTTHLGAGVLGEHQNLQGAAPGVYGRTNSAADQASGVLGELNAVSAGSYAAGVRAHNHSTNNQGAGLWASHDGGGDGVYATSQSGMGVEGLHVQGTGTASGIHGWTASTTDYASGVSGEAGGGSGTVLGVFGQALSSPTGVGVGGYSHSGYGIVGKSDYGFAGVFLGNVYVSGTLSKSAGSFRIDHPLDPAHKYLQHSFVESPDMKDVYDGVVRTNGRGFATVKLPNWFQALNKDFRYQLTSLSGLQEVAVAKEISQNRFTIQSEKPNSRVSWQVTGIRHDAYANAHRIQTVVDKPVAQQGEYLHPELYGKPRSLSVIAFRAPSASRRTR